jgi:hypothetical protein
MVSDTQPSRLCYSAIPSIAEYLQKWPSKPSTEYLPSTQNTSSSSSNHRFNSFHYHCGMFIVINRAFHVVTARKTQKMY